LPGVRKRGYEGRHTFGATLHYIRRGYRSRLGAGHCPSHLTNCIQAKTEFAPGSWQSTEIGQEKQLFVVHMMFQRGGVDCCSLLAFGFLGVLFFTLNNPDDTQTSDESHSRCR
jgi:hypothetical protein